MNKKITFLAFSFNDNDLEQSRVSLFFKSLLEQDCDEWRVIFWDASSDDKKFKIPQDKRITVLLDQIDKKNWNPAYIRNLLALKVETEMLCHTNSDICFAKNFVSTLRNKMGNDNKLLCCVRGRIQEKNFKLVRDGKIKPEELVGKVPKNSQGACGECQCMKTRSFIDIGGYYGKIKKDVVQRGDWASTAAQEDCDLVDHVCKKKKWSKAKHDIKLEWITKDTWLMHLWHLPRENKAKWCKNRNKKK